MNFLKLRAFIMLIILVTISSCGLPYCIKAPFSDEDLEWMKPYSVGDTLIFEEIISRCVDTIIVKNKNINDVPNSSLFDLKGCNWMEGDNTCNASADYKFDVLHLGSRYYGLFVLYKESKYDSAVFSVTMFNRYTKEFVSTSKTVSYLPIFPCYRDIVQIENLNSHIGKRKLTYDITTIYWSKDAGLIGYQTSDAFYRLKGIKCPPIVDTREVTEVLSKSQ